MKHQKFIARLRRKHNLSNDWKIAIDVCGMLHVYDPSGASAEWLGDRTQV